MEEAFGTDVAIAVAFGTHAAAYLVFLQQMTVSVGAGLSTIHGVDQSRLPPIHRLN